ncbi:hypothetical protein LCGC14_2463390, partial [marine sediment metagenome]
MAGHNASGGGTASARSEQLEDVLQISIDLSAMRDRKQMLGMILTEARRLSGAEAGSLYIRRDRKLQFEVAQNDAIDVSGIARSAAAAALDVGGHSVAGLVADSGRTVNVADSYRLEAGAPFRVDRDFDSVTGYRTRSILAIPLTCPDGEVIGVLELINHIGADGQVGPFDEPGNSPIASLAAVAAVSVHNALLAEQLKQAHLDTTIRLAVAAEFRHQGTADHIRRMSDVCACLAGAMGLGPETVEFIHAASPMHDVGKVSIPD